VKAMTVRNRQIALVLALLVSSTISLYPAIAFEKPQQGSTPISIDAYGQAFSIPKAKSKSVTADASLTLLGSVQSKGQGEMKLYALTGTLRIGSTNYTITEGKGEVNNEGSMEIKGKTSDGNRTLELALHGCIQGTNVTFTQPESKLSSHYFLSLTGKATLDQTPKSTTTTESDDDEIQTVILAEYSTVTETVTETATQSDTTSTVTVTETMTITVASLTVTTTVANSTVRVNQT